MQVPDKQTKNSRILPGPLLTHAGQTSFSGEIHITLLNIAKRFSDSGKDSQVLLEQMGAVRMQILQRSVYLKQ